jgi:hypothetical protein
MLPAENITYRWDCSQRASDRQAAGVPDIGSDNKHFGVPLPEGIRPLLALSVSVQ